MWGVANMRKGPEENGALNHQTAKIQARSARASSSLRLALNHQTAKILYPRDPTVR